MPVLFVLAEERSALAVNAPTVQGITAAFRRARLALADPNAGDWIGPAPRVTRTAIVGERFATYAAWPFGWPAGGPWSTAAPSVALRDELVARLQAELAREGVGWQPVLTAPWSDTVNGPVAWWSSGQAAVTQTAVEFPTGTGRLDATENPRGPTSDATHPTSPRSALASAGDLTGAIVTGAAVLGGLYLLAQMVDD